MGLNIAMLSIHSSPIGDLGTRDTGGMSVYVREVAQVLGRLGHCIDIFTQHNPGQQDPVIDLYDNVRLIHLSGGANENIAKSELYEYLPNLLFDLKAFQNRQRVTYDVIHSHYWLSGVLGAMIQEWWHVPHFVTYHTIGVVKNRVSPTEKESEVRLANEKTLADVCDGIVVPSANEKEYLIQYYDALQDKIWVIPCGVNLERFKPMAKAAARRQLAFSNEAIIVLYVGRYSPVKGLDHLFKALSYLKHLDQLRLVLVGGDGEHSRMYEHLQSVAKGLNIQDRLVFAGRVHQKILPVYYSAADVFVVPSHYESFGLVTLEALACGTPVVATPVGAMKTIIQDGVSGYVADNLDAEHFAQLVEAIVLKQLKGVLSPAEIRASVTRLTWTRSASLLLEAYQAQSEA
ncbi:MAG: glycosyltransferase [Desulfobacterales bacterium]|nr:MAG: glycosyltransferase [Desulfobacterales bacterium]